MKVAQKKEPAALPAVNPYRASAEPFSLTARAKVKVPRATAGDAAAAFELPDQSRSNFWPCVFTLIKVIVGAGEESPDS
jgi:hypothetical protein